MIQTIQQQHVDEAITSRKSVRAFLPDPIERAEIEQILAVASRAPSGSNIQPWKAYVITGEPLRALSEALLAAYEDPEKWGPLEEEYRYYPHEWASPYIDRRRTVGIAMYKLLGIGKQDKDRMRAQHGRNFRFFDAPVGLMFSIDRTMNAGSWLDFGCFLQNIMTAARGRGLDTCPQAAFNPYHRIIRSHISMPDSEILMCGMALGKADHSAVVNSLQTEREPVSAFTRFIE